MAPPPAGAAENILSFWFEETEPGLWFQRDGAFDKAISKRFGGVYKDACDGVLEAWRTNAPHCLALIILLDQFSRNIHRDKPLAFAQDEKAMAIAREAIGRRFDENVPPAQRAFFYMPFMHAENSSAQDECVRLFKAHLPGTMNIPFTEDHRDIIARFGRFPHRNKVLGRASTPEEIEFLNAGGFNP